MNARPRGRLFIISAPSGSGKTTLCKKLLEDDLELAHSISATTRPPRPDEKDGVDYHFISKSDFERMIKKGAFLEYEENFGNFYGTPRKFIADSLKESKSVLLSIDVKGAMKVRKAYPEESVLVFILPPSLKALKSRLESRRQDRKKTILDRLKLAKKEISYKSRYDYRIINDKLKSAYHNLKDIVIKETKMR